jgi:hypothetical protein
MILSPERYAKLDEKFRAGIERYIERQIHPGSFLTAVLSNDLRESFGKADQWSREKLFDLVCWLYSYAPGNCWGSPAHVREWLEPEPAPIYRSTTETHKVIAAAGDWACSATVKLGRNGKDAEIADMLEFEQYDADGELIMRHPNSITVPSGAVEALEENAIVSYYEQTEIMEPADPPDWRDEVVP